MSYEELDILDLLIILTHNKKKKLPDHLLFI